jgi:hypothetical protein
VGLRVAGVLRPADRHQRVVVEQRAHHGQRVGDREGVAVEKDDQIVVVGHLEDAGREQVQLAAVRSHRGDDDVELRIVLLADALEARPHAHRLVHVAPQVLQLDVDPLLVAPMDGRDVQHRYSPRPAVAGTAPCPGVAVDAGASRSSTSGTSSCCTVDRRSASR